MDTIILIATIIGFFGFLAAARWMEVGIKKEDPNAISAFLLLIAMGCAGGFVFASALDCTDDRIYLWIGTLSFTWFLLLHLKSRRGDANSDTKSFLSVLLEKLASLFAWTLLGAVLGLVFMFLLGHMPLGEIGRAEALLDALQSGLKKLKYATGATLIPLSLLLVVQWRFPALKQATTKVWHGWGVGQKYLGNALLVLTSLFCFTYTGTFDGGTVTPLSQRIDEAGEGYQQLVWQADIDLSAKLRMDAYNNAYNRVPPQLQLAFQQEIVSAQIAATIPAKYLPPNYISYAGHLPRQFSSDQDGKVVQAYTDALASEQARNESRIFGYSVSNYLESSNQYIGSSNQSEDQPAIPRDLPVAASIAGSQHLYRVSTPNDQMPVWLQGLPGELGEKIVDRTLDTENLHFIELFGDQFPLIGKLLGVVDGQINTLIAEKIKLAAGRIVDRRLHRQPDQLAAEQTALAALLPATQPAAEFQGLRGESTRVEQIVEQAREIASADLKTAVDKELASHESAAETALDELSSGPHYKTPSEDYSYDFLYELDPSVHHGFSSTPCPGCSTVDTNGEDSSHEFHPEPMGMP